MFNVLFTIPVEKSSIHIHLERELSTLGFNKALKALDLVVEEMCADKGFKRHDGTSYHEHLIEVAQLLLNFGFKNDEDLIIAALLHDIIEDVPGYSKKLIEREFGETVAEVVWKVTKKPGVDYKNNHEAMNDYLQNISTCWRASLIKTADRMHNFSTLGDSSYKHRKAQLKNTMDYFIPFFKYCRQLYVRHEAFYHYAKISIVPVAKEIERYISDFEALEKELNELKAKCGECIEGNQ